jgi:predicted nucleic acid-binding protein
LTAIVVDSSVLVAGLAERGARGAAARRRLRAAAELIVPHGADLEVLHVLRGMVQRDVMTVDHAWRAVVRYRNLPLTRYGHEPLVDRIWELRNSVTSYDAAFVALAEMLGKPLLTADERLCRAHGPRCAIEMVR